jgi:hypothetical protein
MGLRPIPAAQITFDVAPAKAGAPRQSGGFPLLRVGVIFGQLQLLRGCYRRR